MLLLQDFTAAIHRPARGFRWQWQPSSRVLALVPQDSSLAGSFYDPFVEAKGLFLDFAKLEASDSSILAFADRYGDLFHPGPTTSVDWSYSICEFGHAVGLWQAIATYKRSVFKDKDCLKPYIWWEQHGGHDRLMCRVSPRTWPHPLKALAAVAQQVMPFKESQKGALLSGAEWLLFYLLNARTRPAWENMPERAPLALSYIPNAAHLFDARVCVANLIDVFWIQLAYAAQSDTQFDECQECGRPFPRRGKRTDRMFCSDACRVRAHRKRASAERDRWAKVAELYRLGKGPKQISTEVGIPMKAVKEWLKENQ